MSISLRERLSLVVVDDDEFYREYATAMIEKNSDFVVYGASCGEDLYDIVSSRPIDCVVLDYNLGNENAFSVKERLHTRYKTVPPIVMLTGDEGQGTVIKAFRLGINDYVPKHDLTPEVLISAILNAVDKDRKEQEIAAELQRLTALAAVDGLTGLANRRTFDEAISREFKRTKRDKASLGLIMIDVDWFKSFNDRYGHPAGDECLRQVSDIIKTAVHRPGDITARYGGEEFAILLPNTDESGAATIASRIQRTILDLALQHEVSIKGFVTISAGVAAIEPNAFNGEPAALLRYADRALYAAKASGRDTVMCASDLPAAPHLTNPALAAATEGF